MNKEEKVREVLELYHKLSGLLARYAFEYWKNLEVPLAQLKSLLIISVRGSINTQGLAQELEVTPGNVTGIIDRLEEQGLILRSQNPGDRRINLIQLTEKGQDIIANIHESGVRQMAEILNHVTLEGLDCLRQGIELLLAAVEEHQKENSKPDS